MGNAAPVDTSPNYVTVSGTFVFIGGTVANKRYTLNDAGTFRSLLLSGTTGSRVRTVQIVTQASATATDAGNGFHTLNGLVMTGAVTNPRYTGATSLTGTILVSDGYTQPNGAPPTGAALHGNIHFTVFPTLTDPIPSGEALGVSVARVTSYLQAHGYIEFSP